MTTENTLYKCTITFRGNVPEPALHDLQDILMTSNGGFLIFDSDEISSMSSEGMLRVPGGPGVSVKITNIGTQNFDHTTVKLDFPADALAVEKASVFPPMKGDDRALVESSFYWLNINIAAGKTRKFTLWVSEEW